jgi:subtilisin family serine protease
MNKVWSLGVLMVAVLLAASVMLGIAPGVAAQGKGPPERFLVFTDGDSATNDNVHKKAREKDGRVITTFHVQKGLDVLLAEVPGEAKGELAGVKGVKEVSPDIPGELLDDGGSELQWGVDRVDADCVWSLGECQPNLGSVPRQVHATGTPTGAGVRIAIVDTGIDMTHPDLEANLAGQPHANCADTPDDSCSTTLSADDGYGHGTHVAGIAAAVDNAVGVIGVAPGASLLAVEACNENSCTLISVWNGIRYVSNTNSDGTSGGDRRADVINISLGWGKNLSRTCPSCVTTFQTVINEAWNKGVVTVAAAGNEGNSKGSGDNITYPARLNDVVAVAATMSNDVRASFSSTGPALDLAAPGYGIYSTLTPGAYCTAPCSYGTLSGTSMAAPHVVGAAALVIQPLLVAGWSNATVVNKLTSTADDLNSAGWDSKYGWGLLDVKEAATGTP